MCPSSRSLSLKIMLSSGNKSARESNSLESPTFSMSCMLYAAGGLSKAPEPEKKHMYVCRLTEAVRDSIPRHHSVCSSMCMYVHEVVSIHVCVRVHIRALVIQSL